MKSLDYVPTSPKTTISISNGINLTFNICCNLVITNGYIGSLEQWIEINVDDCLKSVVVKL
jgi:hypothetical protein